MKHFPLGPDIAPLGRADEKGNRVTHITTDDLWTFDRFKAGQSFGAVKVALGDVITYQVSVAKAEEKKGRFWVTFTITAAQNSKVLMQGGIVSIWAA